MTRFTRTPFTLSGVCSNESALEIVALVPCSKSFFSEGVGWGGWHYSLHSIEPRFDLWKLNSLRTRRVRGDYVVSSFFSIRGWKSISSVIRSSRPRTIRPNTEGRLHRNGMELWISTFRNSTGSLSLSLD